jgi:thymidylate synthase
MTFDERKTWYIQNISSVNLDKVDESCLDRNNVPKRKLSCLWNQRSVDTLLGLPFNILSYAILTHMIAQCTNMTVDELIFNGGDCHIYENQVSAFNEQAKRNPIKYASPILKLNPNIKNIDDFKYDDIKIVDYQSYPAIKYPLSVGL